MNERKSFMNAVTEIVYQILEKENLLKKEWHVGKVESVISSKLLNVYVDASSLAQEIPCNPNETYSVNDEVWVQYVNGDQKNKFVRGKRGV